MIIPISALPKDVQDAICAEAESTQRRDDTIEARAIRLVRDVQRAKLYEALSAAESVVTNIAAEVQPGSKSRLAGAREVLAALYALAERQGWRGRDRNNTKTAREGKE